MELTNLQKAQQICVDVFNEKYAKGNETIDQVYRRVSVAVAQAEKPDTRELWANMFEQNMHRGALGAGRIMSSAGTGIKATLINCFVQPVGDTLDSIYKAVAQSAETMSRGGGVGYNFSCIRPKGAAVKGRQSVASGPCSYIDVFDASCKTIESAGARRGAQMGIINIDHPDIMEFITAKRKAGRWKNFNVSVGVFDDFMEAKNAGATWNLIHKAEPSDEQKQNGAYQLESGDWCYETVLATELWDKVMYSTYDCADPGIVFLSRINSDNNLRYAEVIEATNPCGEQPLPAYGCCNLGPINLTRFVGGAFTKSARFDFVGFKESVALHVRFLDNVLDVTYWPLAEQKAESDSKRRVGVGFTGLANMLAMLGLRYDRVEGLEFAAKLANVMRLTAYRASVELAKERGAFPLFNADDYLEEGTFASRLPDDLKNEIRTHGIRNSHLLSVAPVGTISLAFCQNVGNGIEPPFSYGYMRLKRMQDGSKKLYPVVDYGFAAYLKHQVDTDACTSAQADEFVRIAANEGYEPMDVVLKKLNLPSFFVTAMEMSPVDHLKMVAAVAPYIDSAISKTVNVPLDCTYEDFKGLYDMAHAMGIKGVATFRKMPDGEQGILRTSANAVVDVAQAVEPAPDFLNVAMMDRPLGDLEAVTRKVSYSGPGGDQSLFLTIGFDKSLGVERPTEIFVTASPDGVPSEWVASFARSQSLLAKAGLNFLAKSLKDSCKLTSDKGVYRCGSITKSDGSKVPRFHGSEVALIAHVARQMLIDRGTLDDAGTPIKVSASETVKAITTHVDVAVIEKASVGASQPGKHCDSCGAHAVVKRDGCEFCTSCGAIGACG